MLENMLKSACSYLAPILVFGGCVHSHAAKKTPIDKAVVLVQPSFGPKLLAQSSDATGFCQVLRSGRIRCRLMDPFPVGGLTPSPLESDFTEIVSYDRGFCALAKTGKITCWRNMSSKFYPGIQFDRKYLEIASDQSMVCGIAADGSMDCAAPESNEIQKEPPNTPAIRMPGGPFHNMTGGANICAISTEQYECFPGAFPTRIAKNQISQDSHQVAGHWAKAVMTRQWVCGLSAGGKVHCSASFFQQQIAGLHDVPLHLKRFENGNYVDIVAGLRVCAQRVSGEWECEDDVHTPVTNLRVAAMTDRRTIYLVGIDAEGDLVSPFIEGVPGIIPPGPFMDGHPRGGFVQVYGQDGTCAIRADESVYCDSFRLYDDDRVRGVESVEGCGDYMMKSSIGHFGQRRNDENGDGIIHGRNDERNETHHGYAEVQHGNDFGCGLKQDGLVECWGTIDGSKRKVRPPNDRMSALALGGVFACGIIKIDGSVKCWGNDYFGQNRNAPREGRFTELRTSYLGACATRDDNFVVCWGGGFEGTFETPFIPSSYALSGAGLCGVDPKTRNIQCWGTGFVWD